ncbi:hypothetical protein [Thiobacillus denitrificans]|uniref:Uncharacterized protein n=1 Tax=Thiobacillus denitrificans TaxID=36861 RepID=A0A106BIZ5_THIDE|nr:hypothetical protein [Thiobacillus denitrificans]KVW93340.1 hypothetical protein ABW22_14505 [Thiobacillus denitrificans]
MAQLRTIAVNERGLCIGDSHHNARYSDRETLHVLEMRTKERVAVMDMTKSTVACVCKATRRCQIAAAWKKIVRGLDMKKSTKALVFCFFAGLVGYGLMPFFTDSGWDIVPFIFAWVCLAAAGANEWRGG